MKRRRTLIVSLLLIAALALGIGYAAITDTLTIGGNANVKPHAENFSVIFSEVKEQNKCTATILNDKTVASFATTYLANGGETATAIYVVKNESPEYKATIAAPTINITSGDEYFDVATDFGTETKTLAPGETFEYTVTVTLDRAVVEEQSCEFTITNNVAAVEAVN